MNPGSGCRPNGTRGDFILRRQPAIRLPPFFDKASKPMSRTKPYAKLRLALITLALGAFSVAHAGTNTWTSTWNTGDTTSPTGNVNAIATNPYVPSQILVSTGNGLVLSENSGLGWSGQSTAINGLAPKAGSLVGTRSSPISALTRLPNATNYVFAGTSTTGGLYRITNNAFEDDFVAAAADGTTVTAPTILPNSWTAVTLPNTGPIKALAPHPTDPTQLAISVAGFGVYVLTNANASILTPAQADASYGTSYGGIGSSGRVRTGQVYCNTANADGCGATFTASGKPGTPPSYTFYDVTLYTPETWASAAPTWTGWVASNFKAANALAWDPNNSTKLYAGMAGQGVWVSVDGGANWAASTTTSAPGGITPNAFNIVSLITTNQNGTTVLYAATTGSNAGVYQGVVSGTAITWTKPGSSSTLPGLSNVRALAADTISQTRIYAGTFGFGVYTIDTSVSTPAWVDISNGLNPANNSLYVTSLAVDPLNPARIYAGTYYGFYSYEQIASPQATVSPKTLSSFTSSITQGTVTLTNTGVVPLTFTSASATGPFSVNSASTCSNGLVLAVNTSCSLLIDYASSQNNYSGTLSIATSDTKSPATVTLTATASGNSATASVLLTDTSDGALPSPLLFTAASPQQTIKLKNNGSAPLSLTSLTGTGAFQVKSTGCPSGANATPLNTNASCTITVVYTPTTPTTTSETGLLIIASNDPASPKQLILAGGNSTSQSTSNITTTPTSITFPGVPVLSMSAVQNITLTNNSGSTITLNSVVTDNTAFVADWTACNKTMDANSSCAIKVAYTPINELPASASLKITVNGGTLITAALNGTSADQTTMTGATYGSANALTLTGNFFFSSREKTSTGNLYIMAYANGQWFSFDGFSWIPWLTGQPRTYGPTATYASKSLTVFNRIDVSQLKGATFFLAYGSKISDVIRNQTFALIYTAP